MWEAMVMWLAATKYGGLAESGKLIFHSSHCVKTHLPGPPRALYTAPFLSFAALF
jgi:hypothetical protein